MDCWISAPDAEDKGLRATLLAAGAHPLNDGNRLLAEGDAMLLANLHAAGSNGPDPFAKIDLLPSHPKSFAGARGGEDRKLERTKATPS